MFAPVVINGKARSLSIYKPTRRVYASEYNMYCEANGKGWQLDDWSNVCMIRDLVELLCRSTDTQKHYETGLVGGEDMSIIRCTIRTIIKHEGISSKKSVTMEEFMGSSEEARVTWNPPF